MAMKRCDCGAEYPDGAEYCPNCGRPLTAEALAQERAANAFVRQPDPEEQPELLPISFGNPAALRACYWPAALAAMLTVLPLFIMLCWVWYPAAGFAALASYRKRTGSNPTVTEGARLGWITGVIAFTLILLLVAVSSFAMTDGFGPVFDQMQAIMRENNEIESADAIARMASDPALLARAVLTSLVLTFPFVTALTTLGGALGARVLQDE